MDGAGNLAIGFSASDATNILGQGEPNVSTARAVGNRRGDYSALTVDPSEGMTFWFTAEYYAATAGFNWRARIGSFTLTMASPTPTPTPTPPHDSRQHLDALGHSVRR